MRPWHIVKIQDCGEPLLSIHDDLFCLNPHPYLSLGAPYGTNKNPWLLRSGVLERLIFAENLLSLEKTDLKLAIYDAWRPLSVQVFMIDYAIRKECNSRGINMEDPNDLYLLNEVKDEVNRFWAMPTSDPATPPPHCTGGAVDLTLADLDGNPLDMGGEIDAIGDVSQPNYYAVPSVKDSSDQHLLFNSRRSLLSSVMQKAGFTQHPNEWWHFSFGDQLWGWMNNYKEAIYGAVSADNNSATA